MHIQVQNLNNIKLKIKNDSTLKKLKIKIPNIIAISKTFSSEDVLPLIEYGHIHFGENKIQEAENKWQTIKNKYRHLKLHMVGKLQSNKAKNAVQLFDYIHSLDSKKLANKIFNFENKLNKKLKYFIQVNLAKESQKSGISIQDLESFYKFCTQEISGCVKVVY